MKRQIRCVHLIRNLIRLTALWLFVALWWGLTTLAPMQIHNQLVRHDLLYIIVGLLIFLFFGFGQRSCSSGEDKSWKTTLCESFKKSPELFWSKKEWTILLILLIGLDIAFIFYFHSITVSFLLSTLCLFLLGRIIDLESFSEAGYLLLLSSLGLGVTKLVMNFFRARPQAGIHFFSYQISGLLNLFEKQCDFVAGAVLFQGKKVTCDMVKLGFYPWLAFTFSFLAVIFLAKCNFKKKVYFLIIGFFLHYLYLLLRFSYVSTILPKILFAGIGPFNLLYWRVPLISFIPLIFLWLLFFHESKLIDSDIIVPRLYSVVLTKNDFLISAALVITVLLLTISFSFYGFTKHRKVHCLIDEIHSDWESSLTDFNEHIFGTLAENSYHSFLDYLRHFYPVTILTDTISPAPSLKGVETSYIRALTPAVFDTIKNQHPDFQPVLILKCITTPFAQEEIEVIKDFVFQGGSVFLIGDHTDVFFMNKNINELSRHFGIRFEQNSVYFVDGGWIISDPSYVRIHPVTQYVKRFIWATGDSLTLDSPAFPLIYSHHTSFADQVNYFYDNFFGNTKIDAEELFGSFCLMAGSRYGEGKVVAFTDSTCFNNYLMFTVGRRELIAGIFGWLGDKGNINPFPWFAVTAICFLLIFFLKRKPDLKRLFYQFFLALALGLVLGYFISYTLNNFFYPPPKSIRTLPPKIILEAGHGPRHCLSYGNSEEFLAPTSYDNLLYNIGRINVFPQIEREKPLTQEILNGASCLIMASPTKNFCKKEKNAIKYYIASGGSLILIEGANRNSTINQIANLFGFNIRLDEHKDILKYRKKDGILHGKEGIYLNPAPVEGGEVLFEYNEQMPVVCFQRKGKGLILVIGDDGLFTKRNFNSQGSELVTLQCDLIKSLISRDEIFLKSIEWKHLL